MYFRIEIKGKNGGSLRIIKSIAYNDGGALTMLPAVIDSATNSRVRVLNQLQNGRGRPELSNSQVSNTGTDFNFDSDVESRHSSVNRRNDDTNRFIDWENIANQSTSTTTASIDEESGSDVHVGTGVIGSHVPIEGGSSHVSGGNVVVSGGSTAISSGVCCAVSPVVISPITPRPVVAVPVIVSESNSGVCCGQSRPVVVASSSHSRGHGKLKKLLEKSIDYHRRKQMKKQNLLNKLASKRTQTTVVAVLPAHHVHNSKCGHQQTVVAEGHHHQSRLTGLKELIAYKRAIKAQKFRSKIDAIHARKAQKYNKCPTCCCN